MGNCSVEEQRELDVSFCTTVSFVAGRRENEVFLNIFSCLRPLSPLKM